MSHSVRWHKIQPVEYRIKRSNFGRNGAAYLLTVSCTLLAAVPWNGLEHTHRKARLCVSLSDSKKWCFDMFRILKINQNVKNFLRLRKVEVIKWINLINVLLGLLINGSRLTKTNFVFGLVSLDCRLLENFFWAISKKEMALSFFSLLDYASRTCSMPRQYFLFTYLLPNHEKYYLNFHNFSTILKHRGKSFVVMTSIVHLFSNRS